MLNLFNLNTFYTLVNDIFFEPLSQFEIISYSSNLVSFVFKDYYPELFYNVKPAYPFMVDYLEYLALRSEKVKIGKYLVPKAWLNFGLLNVLPSLYITQILRFRYAKMMDGDASFVLEKQNLLEKFLIFFNNINSSFFLLILILLLIFSFLKKKRNIFIISTSWYFIILEIYNFVLNILNSQVGKIAQKFFPYVFSIFIIILLSNVFGMFLFAFTLTSHIMVTFTLGVSSFVGLTILGFFIQKLSFFNLFLPKGIPAVLIPLLFVVELISYVSRALSLSIRLFANLMSGHTLLHILSFFISKLCKFNYIIGFIGFLLIIAIILLEISIGLLQAYVFTILLCIYLNDVLVSSAH